MVSDRIEFTREEKGTVIEYEPAVVRDTRDRETVKVSTTAASTSWFAID